MSPVVIAQIKSHDPPPATVNHVQCDFSRFYVGTDPRNIVAPMASSNMASSNMPSSNKASSNMASGNIGRLPLAHDRFRRSAACIGIMRQK
jgi:hypothetical protein